MDEPITGWCTETKKIFLTALGLTDPSERMRYLDEACGEHRRLRDQVEHLLAASVNERKNPLESVVRTLIVPDGAAAPELDIGETIGPYQLLRTIGEGGMGVVYLALQTTPVRRQVALKIIRPGMVFSQVLARFESERQALALMDHPNIARVLDVGTTEQGRPYFAMEFVDGMPITEYCQQRNLSIREQLQLFRSVCDAIQHAHHKGIIHRDLKPSNILVQEGTQGAVVKVIDFGIAKVLDQDMGGGQTIVHGLMGTPMYMSPEQMDFTTGDIDTRSDVYSLGVLLYELLAGSTPFDRLRMQQSSIEELQKIITECDPPRPSQRLSATVESPEGRESPTVSERARALRSELDWVAMKAMDKDRTRRYQTPDELSADVRRFLEGEPVQACPPSTWYQLTKLARRHRLALATSAVILLSLLTGLSLATWQAIRALRAEQLAESRLVEANVSRMETRHLLYASDIDLASQSWQRNDIRRMRELLSNHIPGDPSQPDFRDFEWHLLWKQMGVETRTLLTSERPLYCVSLSPDGNLLAVSGADARIQLLDTDNWQVQRTIDSGQIEVNGLDFDASGTRMASAGDDGTIAIWNPHSGEEIHRFQAHQEYAYAAHFSGDGQWLITCGKEPEAKLWQASDGTLLKTIPLASDWLENLDLSVEGQLALASHSDGLFVWSLSNQELLWQDRFLDSGAASAVNFSRDGRWLAEGRTGGLVSLFSVGPPKEVVARQMLRDGVHTVRISPDTRNLVAGDNTGFLHLFPIDPYSITRGLTTVAASERSHQWQAHQDRVYAAAFLPDSRRIVTASRDGTLVLSDFTPISEVRIVERQLRDFAIVDNEHALVTGTQLLRVPLHASGPPQRAIAVDDRTSWNHVAVAEQSRNVFAVQGQRQLMIISDDDVPQLVFEAESGQQIDSMTPSPDGRLVAMDIYNRPTHDRHCVILYDRIQQRTLWEMHGDRASPMRFTREGSRLAISQNNDVLIVDPFAGTILTRMQGHRNGIQALCFLENGQYLATGSKDRTLKIWEVDTGKEIWSVVAHENEVSSIAAHPHGRTLASVGRDRTIRFWRWRIRRLAGEIPANRWPLSLLEFTPDGRKLVAQFDSDGLLIYDGAPSRDSQAVLSRPGMPPADNANR